MMSRDLDSRIIPREISAVKEWIRSERVFHTMRDHPLHNFPVLGGLWGLKMQSKVERSLASLMFYLAAKRKKSFFAVEDYVKNYGTDQFFLEK